MDKKRNFPHSIARGEYMWIVGIILLVLIFVLFSNIVITCQAVFKGDCQKVTVSIHFFRIRLIKRTINLSDQESVDMSVRQSIEFLQSSSRNMLHKLRVYHEVAIIVLKRLKFCQYYWETEFGTGKASDTGMYAGGLWACKGFLTGYIRDKSKFKKQPSISVTPYFNRAYFHSELKCIVSIRVGQAMYALLKVIRKIPVKKEAVI